MKNITFSAQEQLIAQARRQAAAENTTLNEVFRAWLEQYVGRKQSLARFDEVMDRVAYARAGRKFTREEMNER